MNWETIKSYLPRYMTAIQTIRTVIVGGALGAVSDVLTSPQKVSSMTRNDWKQLLGVAFGGSVIAVMHHFMQPPTNTVNPAPPASK